MNLELQVLLGLNYNFIFNDGLNDSSPQHKDFDFSDEQVIFLISQIESTSNVFHISLNGSEVLFYIDQISDLIKGIRHKKQNIHFSITTNGLVLERHASKIESLHIDSCFISYDVEDSKAMSFESLEKTIQLAKTLFKRVELNVTSDLFLSIKRLNESKILKSIKVNFESKKMSDLGQPARIYNDSNKFGKLSCPNLKLDGGFARITYIPFKGFSICSGPVIFEKILNEEKIFFKTLNDCKTNIFYKFIQKITKVETNLSVTNSCSSCRYICSQLKNNDISNFLKTPWENVINNYTLADLERYNNIFYPKFVKFANIGAITNPWPDAVKEINILQSYSGNFLDSNKIKDFTEFTVSSFYEVHQNYYSNSDIKRFMDDQSVFFSLPYKFLYHTVDNKIVSYLILCMWEQHPYFNKNVWHIGYWGIANEVLDKKIRKKIKSDWANLLYELNSAHEITANIDFFNHPADSISKQLNFDNIGLRLDPRT